MAYPSMSSGTPETAYSSHAKTKAIVIPRIPQEIIDEILDHLATSSNPESLQSCALVSKSWVPSCRRHLFRTSLFSLENMKRWLEVFPAPEESPAHFVRNLRFTMQGHDRGPDKFSECIPWFTSVQTVSLSGYGSVRPPWISLLWKLPQSVTSLAIDTAMASLVQVRDVIAQLPNLEDLSLSGSFAVVDSRTMVGIGTVLRGRFGGRLVLLGEHANRDAVDMLLEVPTGLRFTEVRIRGTYGCLRSTARLVEVCGETLVRLSYMAVYYCKSHPFFWPSWPQRGRY